MWVPFFPHPSQHLVWSVFLYFSYSNRCVLVFCWVIDFHCISSHWVIFIAFWVQKSNITWNIMGVDGESNQLTGHMPKSALMRRNYTYFTIILLSNNNRYWGMNLVQDVGGRWLLVSDHSDSYYLSGSYYVSDPKLRADKILLSPQQHSEVGIIVPI